MDFTSARQNLICELQQEISDTRVLDAISRVPRELFVPEEYKQYAYENRPLPIGEGQTISQPLIIAIMTEALQLSGHEKVLEIGTGSGYQTAILAELASRVITVERIPSLLERARAVLTSLNYNNIEFKLAGDILGWPPEAPYDAILVTAGAPDIPETLINQLAEDGRLVIPVGPRYHQELLKVIRRKGKTEIENLGGCIFVSLIGHEAWPS